MIWEELNPSLIMTEMEANSYQDVFKQLGGALIKEGYTKSSYVEALNQREMEFPTGLDMNGIGVAIPHTDAQYVNQSATAIAVLKHPVTFIQMGTDDEEVQVKLIFMLSIQNPKLHMDKLNKILAIIQDQSVLEKLLNVNDVQKIIEIIKEKENEL